MLLNSRYLVFNWFIKASDVSEKEEENNKEMGVV